MRIYLCIIYWPIGLELGKVLRDRSYQALPFPFHFSFERGESLGTRLRLSYKTNIFFTCNVSVYLSHNGIVLLSDLNTRFPSNLDVCDCLLRARFRKVCPQCNTVVHAMDDVAAAFGEPENAVKRRKALLSEEELLVRGPCTFTPFRRRRQSKTNCH